MVREHSSSTDEPIRTPFDPLTETLPHPSTWREAIADWPLERRQRWADQAEAFQCQGYDWKRAEFAAWRLVETSEDPPVDAPPEPGPPSSPPQSTPAPSPGKLRDGFLNFGDHDHGQTPQKTRSLSRKRQASS